VSFELCAILGLRILGTNQKGLCLLDAPHCSVLGQLLVWLLISVLVSSWLLMWLQFKLLVRNWLLLWLLFHLLVAIQLVARLES
jgi:uncharacterized membrane protein YedE/YeeE